MHHYFDPHYAEYWHPEAPCTAPWLSQLPYLAIDAKPSKAWAGLPKSGLALPALRVLRLGDTDSAPFGDDSYVLSHDALRLAACQMPALRRLCVSFVDRGALEALLLAPWALQLEALSLFRCVNVRDPQAIDGLVAAPMTNLTRLVLCPESSRATNDYVEIGPNVGHLLLPRILSAPWASSLRELTLS